MDIQTVEDQRPPTSINRDTNITVKLLKVKDKKRILKIAIENGSSHAECLSKIMNRFPRRKPCRSEGNGDDIFKVMKEKTVNHDYCILQDHAPKTK